MLEDHSTRGVIYLRMSSDHQDRSIGQQREWARAACAKEGLAVAAEFEDAAKSGTEATRRISHGDGSARRHVGSYTRADVAVCSNGVAPAPTRGDSSYMFTLRHFDAGTGHRLPARCGADRRHSRGPEISHKWTGMLVDTSSRGRVGLRHPCEEWDD